ncbi:MAG: type II toxin-antitoxin system VapC family toxin [Alphaproteobacteria bacterium]|nr:type II toxin-antitoxin system VapC family toxin [Alphaproteobacteria bacterium]
MKFLVDTHLLLWAAGEPDLLSQEARSLFTDPDLLFVFSAASIWEVAIKQTLGRQDFQADARQLRRGLLDNGYLELALSSGHAAALPELPRLHKDPFDRILIAQANVEGLVLLTSDKQLAAYPGLIRLV